MVPQGQNLNYSIKKLVHLYIILQFSFFNKQAILLKTKQERVIKSHFQWDFLENQLHLFPKKVWAFADIKNYGEKEILTSPSTYLSSIKFIP